ncbi:MAG: sugar transferase [Patescibacteria group bacterium]|jgi:exopolysaccharide biosynthesis polyprenyl glycosylphosphotransferase|nr:sugar transferase [Patescibacteria group bacterium]
MKKTESLFSLILIPLDYVLLILAAISAYHLRFSDWWTGIRPIIFELPYENYINSVYLVAGLCLLVFFLSGLYQIKNTRQLAQEFSKIFSATLISLAVVSILIFMLRDLFDSRFIVLTAFGFAFIYVGLGHVFVRWLQKYLLRYGFGIKSVILVGNSKTTDNLISEFSTNHKLGFKIVKRVKDFSIETAQELQDFITENQVEEIIQSDPNLTKAENLRLFDFVNDNHIKYKYVADLLEVKVLRTEVSEIAGIPIVEVKRTTLDGWGKVFKRIFDIVVSFILITIFSPLIILTIIAIKLDSKGPIFFTRRDDGGFVTRIGEGGHPFKYFKFRSMIPNSDSLRYTELADKNLRSDGPMVKIKDDPRVTRVGKIIRRWSIDELPELFLVLIGRMSLVGPRPHLPEEVAKYENYHRKALTVKPGITGLAQVSGRSDLSFEEEVKLDVYYIENWTMMLDISILFRTPLAVFKHREVE